VTNPKLTSPEYRSSWAADPIQIPNVVITTIEIISIYGLKIAITTFYKDAEMMN
jgi:hypothetical protein